MIHQLYPKESSALDHQIASSAYHEPVLKKQVLEYLAPLQVTQASTSQKYIDATLGDGGHTIELLKLGATVLGIDYSQESLSRATDRITSLGLAKNFVGALGNFKDIDSIAKQNGFDQVTGILFDLGYSSSQLDVDDSGLSFLHTQPLDMRLDKSLAVTAADLVNSLSEVQLTKMFFDLSDERYAKKYAVAIVAARKLKKLTTTKDLADLIVSVAPPGYEHNRIHPATRAFQALRIVVNDEIGNLQTSLPRASYLLLPGGRMIVISFHSLEDKVSKEFGHKAGPYIKVITAKPVTPGEDEIASNVRSRSAKMRVFERES